MGLSGVVRDTYALSNDFGSAGAEDGKRLRELKGATGSGNPDVRKSRSDFRANQKSSISDDEVRTAGSGATEDRGSKGALRLSSLSGTGGPARSKRASDSFEDHERRAASFGRQRVPGREVLRTSCSRRFAPATARERSSLGPCERAMRGATRRESEAALPPRAARKQNLSHRESGALPSSRALRAREQSGLSNPSWLLSLPQSPRLI